jgi:hypothetical protein
MKMLKLHEQELRNLGYTKAEAIAAAMRVMAQHYRHLPKERRLMLLKDILINPLVYRNDETLRKIAQNIN